MGDVIYSVFPRENFVDLGLYQFGWEKCAPSHSFGPASRNHYLFHLVLSGTGTLTAENEKKESITYQVKSGQGFLIFPDQICTYIADNKIPWEYVWIEFDGLRAREAVSMSGFSLGHPIYKARHIDIAELMKSEMLYIVNHQNDSPLHLIGHLYMVIDYLIRSSTFAPITKGNPLRNFYIQEAMHYIEHNFQNDISIEEIAAACGLNRSYFGRIFREALGKSPQEFLINFRMTKASELLKLTNLSIAEVGLTVGYENQLHFSRAFKNVFGISPRQWRSENHFYDPSWER
jgi:AraC-like DNA-binding protein